MIIAVEGTKAFDTYDTFMRAMGIALSNTDDSGEIQVWSAGPHKINSFTAAFCNSSENFLRQKGFKISFSRVHHSWIAENIGYVNYFGFFSKENEPLSKLANKAIETEGCEVGIFRY